MESMGLYPLPGVGCHITVADEPFSILMKEWGIERPDDVPTDDRRMNWFKNGKEIKGRSSLSRWSCGCQNARIGAKEFHAICTNPECGNVFIKADGVNETIYKAASNVQLVGEAYKLLVNFAGLELENAGSNHLERLETLEQAAKERLYRRLDKLIANEGIKPDGKNAQR